MGVGRCRISRVRRVYFRVTVSPALKMRVTPAGSTVLHSGTRIFGVYGDAYGAVFFERRFGVQSERAGGEVAIKQVQGELAEQDAPGLGQILGLVRGLPEVKVQAQPVVKAVAVLRGVTSNRRGA